MMSIEESRAIGEKGNPTSGVCLVDDEFAVCDRDYFDQLLNYTGSRPTGLYIGKRWKTRSFTSLAETAIREPDGKWALWEVEPDSKGQPGFVVLRARPLAIV